MSRFERENFAFFFVIVSFLVLLLVVVGKVKPTPETSITCTTNDSKIHYDDGWKKIEEVDYQRIGALVGKGQADWSCKPGTLVCTAIIEGKAHPGVSGCAWYWRKTHG